MNIGIILFSRTGNTLLVAEKVRDACLAQGHAAVIERVRAENEDPQSKAPLRLKSMPDPARYDALIFGGPVEAFSLSPIMKAYLNQLPGIQGKKAGCFVTQHFPKAWMGGRRAVKQMRALCQGKGADVLVTGSIPWTNKARDAMIGELASALAGMAGKA